LVVCIENQVNLVVINMVGRIVARWVGSSEIVLLSVNQFPDEIVIGLIDEFQNAMSLQLKHEELNSKENATIHEQEVDKEGFYEVFELEETHSFAIPQEVMAGAQINAMIVNQARNSKVFLLGDSKGFIMSYWQNGTFRGKTAVSKEPIIAFVRRNPHIMYSSTK
jgi:ribosomal protein L21